MATLSTFSSRETLTLDAVFPGWRAMLGRVVWGAYDALDPEMPITTLRKWGLSFTVRVRHTRPLLVALVGEAGA
jgi:hypothetical protein